MNVTPLHYLVAATVLVVVATFPLQANVLLPGDTNVLPDVFTLSGTPPLLGSLTGTFNIGGGTLTGTWHDFVLVDPFGVTCTGCLDFVFNVDIDPASSGGIGSLTMARFSGFSTDVGDVSNAAGDNPITVSRGASGSGISFNLIFQNLPLPPGAATKGLVVATNATEFDTGGNVFINGFAFGSGSNITGQINQLFEPVPEPTTMLLLGVGLAGIATFRKRTLRRLLPVLVLCWVPAHAATISYSDNGTFTSATPTTAFSGPSETWAFSFQADTNPTPLSDVGGGGFSLTFSNFSFFLGGSPVAITPVFIRFFSDANGGGFGICFDNGPNAHPGGRTSLPGGPNSTCTEELAAFGTDPIGAPGGAGTMYTGTTSAPTLIPGSFTSGQFGVAVGSTGYEQPTTTVQASAVPEPSTFLLLAAGPVVLGGRRLCWRR